MSAKTSGPDFICIGAQKAGTGWLYEQLRSHPDFWMPPVKEIHYFDRLGRAHLEKKRDRLQIAQQSARDDRDVYFIDQMRQLQAQPEIDFGLYAALFESKGALIAGDTTPGYSTLPDEMVARIARNFPDTKIVFMARDPVERAWSQLSMWVRHGVIARFGEDDVDDVSGHLQRPEVMARSFPSQIVARWRKYLPRESLGIYFFDDLKMNSAEVRRAIINWLGGDPTKTSGDLAGDHNPKATKEKLRLTNKMRGHVAKFFERELKTCAAELGGPAAKWPARYGF